MHSGPREPGPNLEARSHDDMAGFSNTREFDRKPEYTPTHAIKLTHPFPIAGESEYA